LYIGWHSKGQILAENIGGPTYRSVSRRDRDFEQKVETRPKLERAETEMRHETFETKCLQNVTNFFNI